MMTVKYNCQEYKSVAKPVSATEYHKIQTLRRVMAWGKEAIDM